MIIGTNAVSESGDDQVTGYQQNRRLRIRNNYPGSGSDLGQQVQVPDLRPLLCYPPVCPVRASQKSLGLALSSLSLFYIFLWKKVKQCRLFTSLFMHPELVEMCCNIVPYIPQERHFYALQNCIFLRALYAEGWWGRWRGVKAWTGDYAARVYRTLIRC